MDQIASQASFVVAGDTGMDAIHVLLGMITLCGVMWGSFRYMVRYHATRTEDRLDGKLSAFRKEVMGMLSSMMSSNENAEYKLEAHRKNDHARIDARLSRLERGGGPE